MARAIATHGASDDRPRSRRSPWIAAIMSMFNARDGCASRQPSPVIAPTKSRHRANQVPSSPAPSARIAPVMPARRLRRLEDDLRPALLARVELLVRVGRLAEVQAVRDDERRPRPSLVDQVAQLA